MIYVPLICAIITFLVVYFTTPLFIRYLRKIGMVVRDLNKEDKPLIPFSGGVVVMIGMFFGLMTFIFIKTFFYGRSWILNGNQMTLLFASLCSIVIITFIGFFDDILTKRVEEDKYVGLKQWQKPLLTLGAAIPLMVVGAGYTEINIPFIGATDFGLLYPLLFIPIGVMGAANMVNLLAGYNGLEAGLGIIYMGSLGLYAFVNNEYLAALIALVTFISLCAFYLYNKYPAKIFPGDSLTYMLGAVIAVIAITGNMEKAALIVSIPFFIEFLLKLRSKFKADSYGVFKDGKVISKYDKIYSIPHIFTRTGKFSEKQVVYFIFLIEIVFSGLIWII